MAVPASPLVSQSTVLTLAQRTLGDPWRLSLAHARESHLLIWVTRGAAQAVASARPYALSSHTALFIPARTLFSFTFELACFGQTVRLPTDVGLELPEEPQLIRVREPKAQLTLTGHVESLQNESMSQQPYAEQAMIAQAQLMAVWFRRYKDSTTPQTISRETASERLMNAFCALVVQSERTQLSGAPMAVFAQHLGVTPTHLARVCKASCGLSAADVLTQFTLQRARRALEDGGLPANEISRNLGFSSPAYFTRFIGTHTGKTPTQLRAAAM